jgi:hypothetical protein
VLFVQLATRFEEVAQQCELVGVVAPQAGAGGLEGAVQLACEFPRSWRQLASTRRRSPWSGGRRMYPIRSSRSSMRVVEPLARPLPTEGFRQSADFEPFLEATQPFFNDIEEMTHYQVTANG